PATLEARAGGGGARPARARAPQLDPSEDLLGPRLQRHLDLLEAEGGVDLARHRDELLELAVELLGRAVDVRVVLRHGAHAREPGERARGLEAVQAAEVGEADGEGAAGVLAGREEGALTRAGP